MEKTRRVTVTADIPESRYEQAGPVADMLFAIGQDYDDSGSEFGNHSGIRWSIEFRED